MTINKLLIANRGEIAVRISHAAAALGIPSVAIYHPQDETSLHTQTADTAVALEAGGGTPIDAYLDIDQIIQLPYDRRVMSWPRFWIEPPRAIRRPWMS